jgi:hypothetical protein
MRGVSPVAAIAFTRLHGVWTRHQAGSFAGFRWALESVYY